MPTSSLFVLPQISTSFCKEALYCRELNYFLDLIPELKSSQQALLGTIIEPYNYFRDEYRLLRSWDQAI
jgi:hypothetical protein